VDLCNKQVNFLTSLKAPGKHGMHGSFFLDSLKVCDNDSVIAHSYVGTV